MRTNKFKFTYLLGVEDCTIDEVRNVLRDLEFCLQRRSKILERSNKVSSRTVELLQEMVDQTRNEIDRAHELRIASR